MADLVLGEADEMTSLPGMAPVTELVDALLPDHGAEKGNHAGYDKRNSNGETNRHSEMFSVRRKIIHLSYASTFIARTGSLVSTAIPPP